MPRLVFPAIFFPEKTWEDDGMVRHGKNQYIYAGSVLKWRGIKYQDGKNWRMLYDAFKWTPSIWIFHKSSHVSWASAIFTTFSIYAEQSCLVIVPAANLCHLFQQSFIFEVKVDLPYPIMIPCGIPTHEGIKRWKEKGLYWKLVLVWRMCCERQFAGIQLLLYGLPCIVFRDTDLISWSLLNICRFIGRMKDILLFSDTLCLFSPMSEILIFGGKTKLYRLISW